MSPPLTYLISSLALLSPIIVRTAFFQMPDYSSDFDCDDGALLMTDRLQSVGIKAVPILGNLEMTGEKYLQSDHVWVIAEVAGRQVALDRGVLRLDRQHYEGFLISREQLLRFVAQDLGGSQTEVSPANR